MTGLLWVPVALPPALMVLPLLDALDRRLPSARGGRSAPPAGGDVPVRKTRIERFEDAPAA